MVVIIFTLLFLLLIFSRNYSLSPRYQCSYSCFCAASSSLIKFRSTYTEFSVSQVVIANRIYTTVFPLMPYSIWMTKYLETNTS